MQISKQLSSTLDFFRWFAAFMVLINHLRSIIFVDYTDLEKSNIVSKVFYFITGFGHQSVIIFFVLSGFLVGGSILKKLSTNNFSLKTYSIDRLSRLYIVIPLALLLGYSFDLIGSLYFNHSGLYTDKVYLASINYNISERLSPEIFGLNFLMLQTIFTPPLGSNIPLWSLANEFWYYILFPLLVLFCTTKSQQQKIIYLCLFILVSLLISRANQNGNMLLYFTIWLLGTSLWFIKKPIVKQIFLPLIFMLLTLAATRLNLLYFLNSFYRDLLLAFSFGLVINSCMYPSPKTYNLLIFGKINKFMASFSFSLYLMHWPLIVLIVAISSQYYNWGLKMQPNIFSFVTFIIITLIVYVYSFVVGKLTEDNTQKFRILLNKYF